MFYLKPKDIHLNQVPKAKLPGYVVVYVNVHGVTIKGIISPQTITNLNKIATAHKDRLNKYALWPSTQISIIIGQEKLPLFFPAHDVYNTYQAARLARKSKLDYKQQRDHALNIVMHDKKYALYCLANEIVNSPHSFEIHKQNSDVFNLALATLELIK